VSISESSDISIISPLLLFQQLLPSPTDECEIITELSALNEVSHTGASAGIASNGNAVFFDSFFTLLLQGDLGGPLQCSIIDRQW
jgi:hypothetical protein